MNGNNWIQTYTGRVFDPHDIKPELFNIEDIAHALSQQCRFAGHSKIYYSVGEHSVRVAQMLPVELRMWGLMHDASEAYLLDIPRPLKRLDSMDEYRKMEKRVMECICDRFGLPRKMPGEVHEADQVMLATEQRDIMNPCERAWSLGVNPLEQVISPMSCIVAEYAFKGIYYTLGGK
jgi:hypothetical protein